MSAQPAVERAVESRIWVADTEPNERFTLYTRGNVGEVFPHVMSALTGTLIGDAVRQGQVDVFVGMGVLRPTEVEGPLELRARLSNCHSTHGFGAEVGTYQASSTWVDRPSPT